MAKIKFNNAEYTIDDSALSSAKAELQSHLSTVMNGSGATIKLGTQSYNIDAAKLTTATNELIAHLGTISGTGSKIIIGSTEYSVDSTKLINAISELGATLGELEASDTPTVSGVWKFNADIAVDGGAWYTANFTCDGVAYVAMSDKAKETSGQHDMRLKYIKADGTCIRVHNSEEWIDAKYRTIDFGSTPQEVSAEFYAWLTANATKQTAPTLISFTIDDIPYEAEAGMTWAEWCESEYNTGGYVIHAVTIQDNDGFIVVGSEDGIRYQSVAKTDIISSSFSYRLAGNTGGSND